MKAIERIAYSLRTKHRSGHRIHSPYVFSLVRALFMKNVHYEYEHSIDLYKELRAMGLKSHFSYRAAQFFIYNKFEKYCCNPDKYNNEELIVVSSVVDYERLNSIISEMRRTKKRSSVIILNIYKNKECRLLWREQRELSLDLYRMGILIYDEDLNKEYFKLKI